MTGRAGCFVALGGLALATSAASAANGAQTDPRFDECWRAPFAGHLVERTSRAAIIALPAGSTGPAEDFDTPDYAWTGPEGDVYRFKFGDLASMVDTVEFDRFALGADTVGVSRWRDFGGVDRVIGQWHASSGSVREFAISIPIVPADCSSISRAREIIRSVKYINDIDRIRIVDTDAGPRHDFAVVVNEVGDTKRLRKGNPIASENQIITSIDGRGVTVGWYEYGKGRWVERRIAVSRDETVCELPDADVRAAALEFVKKKTADGSARAQDFAVGITERRSGHRTVVVSARPITPDASFVLQVRCGLLVEDVSTR